MRTALAAVLFCALLMPGDGAAQTGTDAVYTVAKGDNLTVIARIFGVTVADLRAANHLTSDLLAIGQELTIEDPFYRWHKQRVRWRKPVAVTSRVIRPFGPYKIKGVLMPSTGVDVAAPPGTQVFCPADGIVRHMGHMDRFGTLLILEHGNGYATVLSPFAAETLGVTVGQAVRRGHLLGLTGPPEPDLEPHVHIELRKNDKAVKPDRLLH